ncbi:hypothetical protein MKX01_020804 [Papaver californicum]|nr:hypothetical protein MKX01_020804 [Papaver californicum]
MSRMGIFLALLLVLTLLFIAQSKSSTPTHTVFSVSDYGAVGDGKTYDTQQIQAAIDACHDAGGGTVRFPKRRYLVGTIFLKSGVVLNLAHTRILGGTKMEDYPLKPHRWYVIDGQGKKLIENFDDKMSVMKSWNTTGLCHGNKYDSNNTLVNDTLIDNGGNAITLKTIKCPVYNLTMAESYLRTKLSAIKLGSIIGSISKEVCFSFDFKGIVFHNINIDDCHRGITMQLHEGGMASDITFSNIKINLDYNGSQYLWRRVEPIYITTCPQDSKSKISNLRFINISSHSEKGGVLLNLKFMNVNLTYYSTNFTDNAEVNNESDGCGRGHFNQNKQPSAVIRLEHIDGLLIHNMIMRWINNVGHLESAWKNVNSFDFQPSRVNNVTVHSFSSYSE